MSLQQPTGPDFAHKSGMNVSQLKDADQAAQLRAAVTPSPGLMEPCPLLRYAVEVIVLGEDDGPISNIAVQLRLSSAQALHARTAADGLARFEGLTAGSMELCLYELDLEAWTVLRCEALPAAVARSQGDAAWLPSQSKEQAELIHCVQLGECTAKVGFMYGFLPATLWEWPGNAALKGQRRDKNILLQGDRVNIPARRLQMVPISVGQRITLRRKGVPETLELRFLEDGEPRRAVPYRARLSNADGMLTRDTSGVTGEDGSVLLHVWPLAQLLTVTLGCDEEAQVHTIDVGMLNPITELSGVQQRLANLGTYSGPIDGKFSPELKAAIVQFQQIKQLNCNGKPDGETLRALLTAHVS